MSLDGTTGQVSIFDGLELSGTTSPLSLDGVAGNANQIMQSNGAGATPSWTTDLSVNSVTVDSLRVNEYANIANNIFTGDSTVFNNNVGVQRYGAFQRVHEYQRGQSSSQTPRQTSTAK